VYPFRPVGKERGDQTLTRSSKTSAFTIHPLPLLVGVKTTNSTLFLPQKDGIVIRQARFDPIGSKLRDKQVIERRKITTP
jgi:hypothetical protein